MINSISNVNNVQNSPAMGKNNRLSLFYINDMHGNIDNMSGMLAASDKFDKETQNKGVDVLKLSAGDNFSGGDEKKNKLVINLLNRMGIEASALGNHEFDSTISTFYKFLDPEKTKFLAANANTPAGSEFYNNIQRSTIIENNGTKYGIVGLMPFDIATTTGNNEKKLEGIRPFDIEESAKIVNDEVKKLQDQGVDRIILVSHIGNDKDKEIVSKLHGVDVIVGGHSHTEVKDVKAGENLFNNADGTPVLILQTGENAKYVGIANIEFDENGVAKSFENNLVKTSQEKSPVLNYFKDAVMGKSPQIGGVDLCEPLPANRRKTPCAWTNLMCDAMRNQLGVDIAFINAANTRKTPKQGTLTERDVMETTPLKNTLLVKQMTEKEIVRAIKESVQTSFSSETGEPGILHASGLSYVADTKGNLKELSFVDKAGNKTPIDINNPSDKPYRVCYDSFMMAGTEYPVFVPDTQANKTIEQTFDFDKDKLAIDYIKTLPNKENLKIEDDKRIQILDETGTPLSATRSHEEAAVNTPNTQPINQTQNAATIPPQIAQNTINSYSIPQLQPVNSNAALMNYRNF